MVYLISQITLAVLFLISWQTELRPRSSVLVLEAGWVPLSLWASHFHPLSPDGNMDPFQLERRWLFATQWLELLAAMLAYRI